MTYILTLIQYIVHWMKIITLTRDHVQLVCDYENEALIFYQYPQDLFDIYMALRENGQTFGLKQSS